jgi:hypothetical protein
MNIDTEIPGAQFMVGSKSNRLQEDVDKVMAIIDEIDDAAQ